MDRGTLRDPILDIEEGATTIQLESRGSETSKTKSRRSRIAIALCLSLVLVGILGFILTRKSNDKESVVTSKNGVVAADHEICSEIGADVLGRLGGTAVDAAVAVAFCLGVVNPTSSGIGGGAFMVVRSSNGSAVTYNMRETAPSKAHQDMFKNNTDAKVNGPLSVAVPGEVAGLYEAWKRNGRLVDWKLLVEPSIKLARHGFDVGSHLAFTLSVPSIMKKIKKDTGLNSVFTKGEEMLKKGDKCRNPKLAETLDKVAARGMEAFYQGDVAKMLVEDLNKAKGIMTLDDLRDYKVNVTDAMVVENVMGYKIQGMWPPSSGTAGFAMVMNVMERYKDLKTSDRDLVLHRLIEAMKYMLAARMDLGDPAIGDPAIIDGIYKAVDNMVSKQFAGKIHKEISDDTTYDTEHYFNKYSQLKDQGTSHFCVVDKYGNVVSMTTTVNHVFGSGFMSPSTGIILNNQMDDFSIPPEDTSSSSLPPAPANYIAPNKRPLSSMMPLIITKNNELAGVIGASGGIYIIPAVIQVFLNHFVFEISPLEAVNSPRVYHKLEPNEVLYEDWEVYNGDHVLLEEDTRKVLENKKHVLKPTKQGAIVQLVVQNRVGDLMTDLTAVCDLRKGGKPAAAIAAPSSMF